MQPDWKNAGRSTDPLAGAEIEKEQNDDIQTAHSTYHVGAWEGVYNTLKKKRYNIAIVQNPTI